MGVDGEGEDGEEGRAREYEGKTGGMAQGKESKTRLGISKEEES